VATAKSRVAFRDGRSVLFLIFTSLGRRILPANTRRLLLLRARLGHPCARVGGGETIIIRSETIYSFKINVSAGRGTSQVPIYIYIHLQVDATSILISSATVGRAKTPFVVLL